MTIEAIGEPQRSLEVDLGADPQPAERRAIDRLPAEHDLESVGRERIDR
jgi:hypothetical protein